MPNYFKNLKRVALITSPIIFFAGGNALILACCFLLATRRSSGTTRFVDSKKYHAAVYSSQPPVLGAQTYNVSYNDARGLIVEQFLKSYNSPLAPYDRYMVRVADKYNLPWNLIPAIAMQESSGGRVLPEGSYNPFGWAIYGDQVRGFSSWEEGIDTVAKGLRELYFDEGLTTPEAITPKYCPPSLTKGGPWAKGIRHFMEALENF